MDLKQIQKLITYFEESKIQSLELELKDFKIKLGKNDGGYTPQLKEISTPIKEMKDKTLVEEKQNPLLVEVKSPLVGTFYASSSPKGKPFVSVGQSVEKGMGVCIIEAMKIMNEITSPCSGIVEKILLNDGDVVGFDQVIMIINPLGNNNAK